MLGRLLSSARPLEAKRMVGVRSLVKATSGGVFGIVACQVMGSRDSSTCATDGEKIGDNPLLMQEGLPRFDKFQPKYVAPGIEHAVKNFGEKFDAFERKFSGDDRPKAYGYDDVYVEIERMTAPLEYSWGMVSHLSSVKTSDELREVHEAAQPVVVKTYQRISQSKPLYDALRGLDMSKLDKVQPRIVEKNIKSMEKSGIGLPEAQKEEFNKLTLEAAELGTKFSNNVVDATKKFKVRLTSVEDVAGLPQASLDLLAQNARNDGEKDASAENGPWLVTLDYPSYSAVMTFAKNRALREKVYRAYISRASEGELDNQPLIQRLLEIRKKKSEMLGYESYAELSLTSKMAEKPKNVMSMLTFLRDHSFDAAKNELDTLRAYAKSNGEHEKLMNWDVSYWSERLKEEKFQFTQEDLRPYFSLDNVLDGLFKLSERLFEIKVVPADGQVPVWDKDVRFFNVIDVKSGNHIASFYLDPYSRPGEKRQGAWMGGCQEKSKALNRIPVAYIVCNGTPPVGDKPSLLTFSDVVTLFHEFGHNCQHLLTTVEYTDAAGINGIEWDAVELPSQFMENWCYDKKTLYGFAKHYETGEPLPDDLFNKLSSARTYMAGLGMLRQLNFGALDMALHSKDYDPHGSKSPLDLQSEIARSYSVMPPLPEDRFLCSFSHIFNGGYSAGYYSYMWAEQMSADAFAQFEEVGLDNDQEIRATGRRFRDTVLSLGGGSHPSEVYRLFRGREPNPKALLRHSGLDTPSSL